MFELRCEMQHPADSGGPQNLQPGQQGSVFFNLVLHRSANPAAADAADGDENDAESGGEEMPLGGANRLMFPIGYIVAGHGHGHASGSSAHASHTAPTAASTQGRGSRGWQAAVALTATRLPTELPVRFDTKNRWILYSNRWILYSNRWIL